MSSEKTKRGLPKSPHDFEVLQRDRELLKSSQKRRMAEIQQLFTFEIHQALIEKRSNFLSEEARLCDIERKKKVAEDVKKVNEKRIEKEMIRQSRLERDSALIRSAQEEEAARMKILTYSNITRARRTKAQAEIVEESYRIRHEAAEMKLKELKERLESKERSQREEIENRERLNQIRLSEAEANRRAKLKAFRQTKEAKAKMIKIKHEISRREVEKEFNKQQRFLEARQRIKEKTAQIIIEEEMNSRYVEGKKCERSHRQKIRENKLKVVAELKTAKNAQLRKQLEEKNYIAAKARERLIRKRIEKLAKDHSKLAESQARVEYQRQMDAEKQSQINAQLEKKRYELDCMKEESHTIRNHLKVQAADDAILKLKLRDRLRILRPIIGHCDVLDINKIATKLQDLSLSKEELSSMISKAASSNGLHIKQNESYTPLTTVVQKKRPATAPSARQSMPQKCVSNLVNTENKIYDHKEDEIAVQEKWNHIKSVHMRYNYQILKTLEDEQIKENLRIEKLQNEFSDINEGIAAKERAVANARIQALIRARDVALKLCKSCL